VTTTYYPAGRPTEVGYPDTEVGYPEGRAERTNYAAIAGSR